MIQTLKTSMDVGVVVESHQRSEPEDMGASTDTHGTW